MGTAFGTSAAGDLAQDHERSDGTFRCVVVWRYIGMLDEGEHLVGAIDDSPSEIAEWDVGINPWLGKCFELVLEPCASERSLAWTVAVKETSFSEEPVDGGSPADQALIVRVLDLDIVQRPKEMYPAALMLSQMVVVAAVEVAAKDSFEIVAEHPLRDFMAA